MTRAQQQLSILLVAASIYMALYTGLIPLPSKIQEDIVPVLPFWALISFGALLLFQLGYGVATFHDVPEAYDELMNQIAVAREDLKKKGVEVD